VSTEEWVYRVRKINNVVRILFALIGALSTVATTCDLSVQASEARGMSDQDRLLFVKTTFTPIKTTKDLPAPIRGHLGLNVDPKSMADPDQPFDSGCVVKPDSPRQHLLLAAGSKDLCIVYFERGGYARIVTLQFYRLTGGKATLIDQAMPVKEYNNIDEIKLALKKKEIK
jgi:hypothetical protein